MWKCTAKPNCTYITINVNNQAGVGVNTKGYIIYVFY